VVLAAFLSLALCGAVRFVRSCMSYVIDMEIERRSSRVSPQARRTPTPRSGHEMLKPNAIALGTLKVG